MSIGYTIAVPRPRRRSPEATVRMGKIDPKADDRERALPKSSSFDFPVYEVELEDRMCPSHCFGGV
jgi:hypothetical protein